MKLGGVLKLGEVTVVRHFHALIGEHTYKPTRYRVVVLTLSKRDRPRRNRVVVTTLLRFDLDEVSTGSGSDRVDRLVAGVAG